MWDAPAKKEMLDYRIEFAVYDRSGVCFKTIVPHYLPCKCVGDSAVHIRTATGKDYYIDGYGCLNTLRYAPRLDFLEERAEVVVRDDSGVCWAAERFGDHQLSTKNTSGKVVIFAEKIPLWRRFLLTFMPDLMRPRILRLDVRVSEEIPKAVILFLAAKSV